jgi:hypothetical protein
MAFADEWRHVLGGTDLKGAHLHAGVLRHQLDGVGQVRGLEDQDAPQLPFRLGKGAVGDGHLAVPVPQRGGVPGALERLPRQSDRPGEACRRTRSTRPSGGCARPRTGCPTSIHRGNPGICISCPPEHGRASCHPSSFWEAQDRQGGLQVGCSARPQGEGLEIRVPAVPKLSSQERRGESARGGARPYPHRFEEDRGSMVTLLLHLPRLLAVLTDGNGCRYQIVVRDSTRSTAGRRQDLHDRHSAGAKIPRGASGPRTQGREPAEGGGGGAEAPPSLEPVDLEAARSTTPRGRTRASECIATGALGGADRRPTDPRSNPRRFSFKSDTRAA